MEKKEHRYSNLKTVPMNPFRKEMNTAWFPNSKKLYKIAMQWEKIVGTPIYNNTQLLGVFNEGDLSVACKSSAWMTELRQRKGEIIDKINSVMGPDFIVNIRFSVSKYTFKTPEKPEKKNEISFDDIEISKEKLDEIEKKLSEYELGPLKDKMRQIYINFEKNQILEKIKNDKN